MCFAVLEYLSQNGCVARILETVIDRIFDVIEKGFEAEITIPFGGWLGSVCELRQKCKHLIRCDGFN